VEDLILELNREQQRVGPSGMLSSRSKQKLMQAVRQMEPKRVKAPPKTATCSASKTPRHDDDDDTAASSVHD